VELHVVGDQGIAHWRRRASTTNARLGEMQERDSGAAHLAGDGGERHRDLELEWRMMDAWMRTGVFAVATRLGSHVVCALVGSIGPWAMVLLVCCYTT
jgi:hypothetical protein